MDGNGRIAAKPRKGSGVTRDSEPVGGYLIATITMSTALPLMFVAWCGTPRPMN